MTTTTGKALATGGGATIGVLMGLQVLDSVDGVMLIVFAPEISKSLGIDTAAMGLLGAIGGVMVALAALPLGVLGDRYRRTRIAGVATLAWAAAAGVLGVVQGYWQAMVARVVSGAGKANEGSIQASLLVDAYHPGVRGRVLGLHRAGQPLGIVVGPLIAAAFAALIPEENEPWRWAFAFLAVPALVLGIAALRLPEPPRETLTAAPRGAFAQLRQIRSFMLIALALGAFGLAVTTVPIYLNTLLEEQLGQDAAARGVITSISAVGGLTGAALSGWLSDRLFRRSPKACLHLAAAAFAVLGIGFALQAHAPDVTSYVVIGVLTQGMTFAGIVPLSLVVAGVTPQAIRSRAFALMNVCAAVIGGIGGALVTGAAEVAWGEQMAVTVVAPAGTVLAGLVLLASTRHVLGDMARLVR
ncbi:Sugar phosphate permease [Lentzea fradiae]|uniref:Sugar phosphate permease n=1 Tax=Lentzea fradiae TaxID=200378 RepID=A0A1G7V7W5_9PSEU|nr:MFS transporter [Lentzea fradiae]SDG55833.1 Sugar phosphate permease [Lentzea fradiae]